MNPALGKLKIPADLQQVLTDQKATVVAAGKAKKAANLEIERLAAAKAAVEGTGSGTDVPAALLQKQQAIQVLQAAPHPNPRSMAIARAEADHLQELGVDFSTKAAIVQRLDAAILAQNAEIARLDGQQAAAQAQVDLIQPLAEFDKNRAALGVRAIESDLVKLKTVLATFTNSPLAAAQPCPLLVQRVADLQKYVDDRAHENDCHNCHTKNKIARTQAAKDLVFAKVARLKELALLPNDATVPGPEKGDYVLAKSIAQMEAIPDETGKTAGKMLGALICRRKVAPFEQVVIYGYSGVVWDQQRAAGAATHRATQALAAAPADVALQQALAAAQAAEIQAKAAEVVINQNLANNRGWAKPLDPQAGTMRSKGGRSETIASLELNKTGNNPVGNCSAPKMIQQAYADDLEPVAMAEAWMGGGDNKDGELVVSCDTCMGNIGFQLCEQCT